MEKIFLDSGNGKVCAVHDDRGGEAAVILAHGYLSDKDSHTNQELTKRLSQAGISTIAFDMYGHGESEGDVKDLTISKAVAGELAVYDSIKERYEKVGLAGSSFTGPVSLICASRRKPAALALKCPVFMPNELWRWRHGDDGIREWKEKGFIEPFGRRWNYIAYEDAEQYDMRDIASKIKAPALVVHGDKDITVPPSQAENLVFSLGSGEKKLFMIEGADHFFKDERHFRLMASVIAEWLIGHL